MWLALTNTHTHYSGCSRRAVNMGEIALLTAKAVYVCMYVYVYDTAGCGRMRCSLRRPARMCRRSVLMNVPVECVLFAQENRCSVACVVGRKCSVFFCSIECVLLCAHAGLAGGASVCAAKAGLRM